MCNILAVLGDREDAAWQTLDAAIELADREHARLTVAKTCGDGHAYVWIAPFAVGGAYIPAPFDSPEEAGERLARMVERVPSSIPVTTVVLCAQTQASLVALLRAGYYSAIIAQPALLAGRRLRRQLRRDEVIAIPVETPAERAPSSRVGPHLLSAADAEDGLLAGAHIARRARISARWRVKSRQLTSDC